MPTTSNTYSQSVNGSRASTRTRTQTKKPKRKRSPEYAVELVSGYTARRIAVGSLAQCQAIQRAMSKAIAAEYRFDPLYVWRDDADTSHHNLTVVDVDAYCRVEPLESFVTREQFDAMSREAERRRKVDPPAEIGSCGTGEPARIDARPEPRKLGYDPTARSV